VKLKGKNKMTHHHWLKSAAAALAGAWITLAAPVMAQPTAEQQNAIRSSCRSDFMSNCSGVTPGGAEALQCLQHNSAKLSPACRGAVAAITPKPAVAAPTQPPAPPAAAAPRPDAIPVLKLNQILHVPTGLYVYQQMHSNFWRVDNAELLKFSLTSNDSCGNTFKEARRNGDQLTYEYHTYWDGMAEGKETIAQPKDGYFYDELPWLVRTIDFSKPTREFTIQLAGSIINSKKDTIAFKPAKISFELSEKKIEVSVAHEGGTDRFSLDRDGPNLLREWTAADGSHYKMKRNLKVDYWNYNKPGDRERALANPMLRQPD